MNFVDRFEETSQVGRFVAAIASGDEQQRETGGGQASSQRGAKSIVQFMSQQPDTRIFLRETLCQVERAVGAGVVDENKDDWRAGRSL